MTFRETVEYLAGVHTLGGRITFEMAERLQDFLGVHVAVRSGIGDCVNGMSVTWPAGHGATFVEWSYETIGGTPLVQPQCAFTLEGQARTLRTNIEDVLDTWEIAA